MTYTTFIRTVYPVTHRSGTRHEVLCVNGPLLYTWDDRKGQLLATLCERAGVVSRAVTIGTRDTQFGQEIVTVDLVPETQGEVVS